MSDTPVEVALDVGAQHGEGPLWDAESGRLWWVDITGQMVHSFDPATGPGPELERTGTARRRVARLRSGGSGGRPGGSGRARPGHRRDAPAGAHRAGQAREPCERRQGRRTGSGLGGDDGLRQATGERRAVSRRGRRGHLRGRRSDDLERTGVRRGGRDASTSPTPPGASWTSSTSTLPAGSATRRRRFLDFTDEQVWPDGMTVDDEGMFWVALGRAGAVHRYRPDGTLDGVVEVPTSNPTSVAFGGPDRGTLYITTSWFDVDPDSRCRPTSGRCDLPVPTRCDRATLAAVRVRAVPCCTHPRRPARLDRPHERHLP